VDSGEAATRAPSFGIVNCVASSLTGCTPHALSTQAHPAPRSLDQLKQEDFSDLLSSIEEGLPAELVTEVQQRLGLSSEKMASLLGVSSRTLERRQESGALTPTESERLYRLVRLFRKAVDVFEREDEARRWLKRPQMRLGEQIPLKIARFEPGAREAERLLGRIEHGIPA
jgi:putative toxin-antitoxin system antitoxin component (TIGR02293 family)